MRMLRVNHISEAPTEGIPEGTLITTPDGAVYRFCRSEGAAEPEGSWSESPVCLVYSGAFTDAEKTKLSGTNKKKKRERGVRSEGSITEMDTSEYESTGRSLSVDELIAEIDAYSEEEECPS